MFGQRLLQLQASCCGMKGSPAATYYHRSCGGEFEDASALDPELHAPYLRRHHDDYCVRTPDEWQAQITNAIFASAWPPSTTDQRGCEIRIPDVFNGCSSMAVPIKRDGFPLRHRQKFGVGQAAQRSVPGLRSGRQCWVPRARPGTWRRTLPGRRRNMGEQGRSYREILAFYYPGTRLGSTRKVCRGRRLPGESVDLPTTNRRCYRSASGRRAALRFAKEHTGWDLELRPQLRCIRRSRSIAMPPANRAGWRPAHSEMWFAFNPSALLSARSLSIRRCAMNSCTW